METWPGPQVFGSKEKESVSTDCTNRGLVHPDFGTDRTGQTTVVSNTTKWCQKNVRVAPLTRDGDEN